MSSPTDFSRRGILRIAGLGAGAGTIGLSLTSCKTGGAGPTTPEAPSGTIQFASYSYTEGKKSPLQKTLDLYQKKNPKVDFEMIAYPFGEYLNQEILRIVGGNRTGVAQFDIGWLPTAAGLGALADVSEAVKKIDFLDDAVTTSQVEGKQVAFPWVTGSLGLMANRELLDAAKVDGVPETIEDFESVLEAVKGLGKDIIPYAAATKVGDSLKDFIQWMQAFGAPVVVDRKITITDEPCVKALAWYKSLLDRGLIAKGIDRTIDARPLYTQRRVAFYDDAVVAHRSLKIPASDKDLLDATEPMTRPRAGSNTSVSRSYGQALAVLSGGDAAASTDLAAFVTSNKEASVQYFKATEYPPTTRTANADPAIKNDPWLSRWTERVTKYAIPDPFWQFAQFAQLEDRKSVV